MVWTEGFDPRGRRTKTQGDSFSLFHLQHPTGFFVSDIHLLTNDGYSAACDPPDGLGGGGVIHTTSVWFPFYEPVPVPLFQHLGNVIMIISISLQQAVNENYMVPS